MRPELNTAREYKIGFPGKGVKIEKKLPP